MKITLKTKALVTSALLVAGLIATAPAHAAAVGPICDGKAPVQTCQGTTSDGAPFVMMVPANFGGTVALYSHGYRYNVDIPSAIPLIGGYKITNTPEPIPGGNAAVANYLFSQGVAVMGSGFARQGWNADSGLKTNVELISLFKAKFTTTTKVVAWGNSLGGFITQGLAEKYPNLVDAVAPMCMADNLLPELTAAGDFLWGLKVLFDPSIKAGNYSAGAAGTGEAIADLGKVFTVMGKLQAGITTGAWPDTSSPAGKALEAAGIPSRAALLLIGLMAGIPTQSAHFDSISGPDGALKVTFPLAVSPALAILENGTNAAALAVLATVDAEDQAGGAVFDNSKTDYASRVESERVIFSTALGGNTVINALLGTLAQAPRATASPAAVTKLKSLQTNTAKVNKPTILMVGVADPITPAGASQRVVEAYTAQYADERAAAIAAAKTSGFTPVKKKLLTIWGTTPAAWTTFSSAGAPITTTDAAPGTNHCNFTSDQYIAVAKIMLKAAKNGEVWADGENRYIVRKAKNLRIDPLYQPALLKYYNS